MRILISNDDGIDAPGIIALAEAMQDLGEVTVIAPDRNRSGASNSLTITQPLRIKERKPNWYAVQGTPTDCVHVATTGFLDELPDIVVSGINSDANLGDDVWYSGTVAAAMEGRLMGLPAVAFSIVRQGDTRCYDGAAEFAKRIVGRLINDPLPESTILNVNVPGMPYDQIAGVEVTRTGMRHRAEPVVKEMDPRGVPIYWVGPAGAEADAGEGTDFWAVREKKVSITPLRVDITKYTAFDQLSQWVATGF